MNTRIESNRQPRSLNESGKPCSRIRPIAFLFVFRNIGQVLSLFSPFILKYFIHSPEIYRAVTDYLDWRCFGLLFSFPFLAFRSFYVGITRTNALSWAAMTAVSVNILCNYLFIFVWGKGCLLYTSPSPRD